MKVAFYGSSLLSSYWNGAATYYRGMLEALAAYGYEITFYEPDVYDRQSHRDIDPPSWARVEVYPATAEGLSHVLDGAAQADVVIKASGVGVFDTELLQGCLARAAPHATTIFWDVDAPATLAEMGDDAGHPLHAALKRLDLVLTYGGGQPVVDRYRAFGARRCIPVYNALDPATHHPVPAESRFRCNLAFLGNRLPDRETRVQQFFLSTARHLPQMRFLLGGSGWNQDEVPQNVRVIGHVGTQDHNAFNCSPQAVLNIARDSMAEIGFSPATRVFEAAGAGACIITDAWEGIEMFLAPGREIIVARDDFDVAEALQSCGEGEMQAIGERARRRILAEHTYRHRAAQVHEILTNERARRVEGAPA